MSPAWIKDYACPLIEFDTLGARRRDVNNYECENLLAAYMTHIV